MLLADSFAGAYTTSCKQSSVPEDGRNYLSKHVELIEIVNKIIIVATSRPFILLYYCLYYYIIVYEYIIIYVKFMYVTYQTRCGTPC